MYNAVSEIFRPVALGYIKNVFTSRTTKPTILYEQFRHFAQGHLYLNSLQIIASISRLLALIFLWKFLQTFGYKLLFPFFEINV